MHNRNNSALARSSSEPHVTECKKRWKNSGHTRQLPQSNQKPSKLHPHSEYIIEDFNFKTVGGYLLHRPVTFDSSESVVCSKSFIEQLSEKEKRARTRAENFFDQVNGYDNDDSTTSDSCPNVNESARLCIGEDKSSSAPASPVRQTNVSNKFRDYRSLYAESNTNANLRFGKFKKSKKNKKPGGEETLTPEVKDNFDTTSFTQPDNTAFKGLPQNTRELSNLRMQVRELKDAKEKFEMKFNAMNKEYNYLTAQVKDMKAQNESLLAQTLEGQNLGIENTLLEKKMHELREHLAGKESSELDKDRKIMQLENQLHNLQQKSSTLEVTLNHAKRELDDRNEQLSTLITFQKMEKEKDMILKMMHNELVELKGNIRVLARFKPEEEDVFNYVSHDTVQIRKVSSCDPHMLQKKNVFTFSKVFRPGTSQEDIYEEVSPFVTSCVDGYNVSVITFGQTGSGKTYTMKGDKDKGGIFSRSCHQLLSLTRGRAMWKFCVRISILQIYNEQVTDLLSENLNNVLIQDDGRCVLIKGLQEQVVSTEEDIVRFIRISRNRRSKAKTDLNNESSRSHFIVMIRVKGKNSLQGTLTHGVLTMCDLAGFEKFPDHQDPFGQLATESKYIGKSLTALSRVFESLHSKRRSVPFRDSKLTHLLKPSLSGDAKCVLILNLSTLPRNMEASVRTMHFGAKALQIALGSAKKNVACITNEAIEVRRAREILAKNLAKYHKSLKS